MKKIVAYVTPVVANGAEATTSETSAGTVKVEALLSDSDAERVLVHIASSKVSSPDQKFATHLVEQELALAGPQAGDLWQRVISDVERTLISQVFADCDGVKTRAAARLGIDRNTLHKKLRQYDLIGDDTPE